MKNGVTGGRKAALVTTGVVVSRPQLQSENAKLREELKKSIQRQKELMEQILHHKCQAKLVRDLGETNTELKKLLNGWENFKEISKLRAAFHGAVQTEKETHKHYMHLHDEIHDLKEKLKAYEK